MPPSYIFGSETVILFGSRNYRREVLYEALLLGAVAGSERGLSTDGFGRVLILRVDTQLFDEVDVARGKRCVAPPYGRVSCCSSCEHGVERIVSNFLCVCLYILGSAWNPVSRTGCLYMEVANWRGRGTTVMVPVGKRFALEETAVHRSPFDDKIVIHL